MPPCCSIGIKVPIPDLLPWQPEGGFSRAKSCSIPGPWGWLWGASIATWGGQLSASEAFYPLSIFRGNAILSAATSVFPEPTLVLEEETKALGGGGTQRSLCGWVWDGIRVSLGSWGNDYSTGCWRKWLLQPQPGNCSPTHTHTPLHTG